MLRAGNRGCAHLEQELEEGGGEQHGSNTAPQGEVFDTLAASLPLPRLPPAPIPTPPHLPLLLPAPTPCALPLPPPHLPPPRLLPPTLPAPTLPQPYAFKLA